MRDGGTNGENASRFGMSALWPSNTRGEIEEKKQLYFDAGAEEFWLCGEDGSMAFSTRDALLPASLLCPDFPTKID